MISKILDWAEKHYAIIPLGFANLGLGIGMVTQGGGGGWMYVAFGLILILIRPVGTSARRGHRIRSARRELETLQHVAAIREWGND